MKVQSSSFFSQVLSRHRGFAGPRQGRRPSALPLHRSRARPAQSTPPIHPRTRRCSACSESSSLSHRSRPVPERRKDGQSCACPCRRVPTGHRAGSPCPGSRGRASRPCELRAAQTSPLMIRLCHSRACRRTDGYGRGPRCDARWA